MKLSLGFTLGLAGLAQLAAADNGFKDSCNSDWYVDGGHYMIANCRRPDGSLVRTRMDLNLCMGRNTANGSLLGKQGYGMLSSPLSRTAGANHLAAEMPGTPAPTYERLERQASGARA